MTTTTYLLCNYSNEKGSHCSSLSIISLSAGQRKEFPFLRHSCVQSLLSYICIQPGILLFYSSKHLFQRNNKTQPFLWGEYKPLDREDVKLKPNMETLSKVPM